MHLLFAPVLALALAIPTVGSEEPPIPEPEPVQVIEEAPEPVDDIKPVHDPDVVYDSTTCNCYNLLKQNFNQVPPMAEIQRRASSTPGNVAVFAYPPSASFPSHTPHVAVVTEHSTSTFTIEEYNYDHCEHTTRVLSYDYVRLIGFITL